jgi:hypothetical protein
VRHALQILPRQKFPATKVAYRPFVMCLLARSAWFLLSRSPDRDEKHRRVDLGRRHDPDVLGVGCHPGAAAIRKIARAWNVGAVNFGSPIHGAAASAAGRRNRWQEPGSAHAPNSAISTCGAAGTDPRPACCPEFPLQVRMWSAHCAPARRDISGPRSRHSCGTESLRARSRLRWRPKNRSA